jgi:hypothetical protein
MKKSSAPEFLLISECVNQLVQGMWGSAPRAEPVRAIRQIEPELSVGFGPRKEYAAALLRADALQGKVPVYVRARLVRTAPHLSDFEPRVVAPEILKRVLPVRGGLSDHPTHIIRMIAGNKRDHDALLSLLRRGELVVRQSDFISWYKQKRAKGNWPSQINKMGPRRARPTKDIEPLRNAILALVHDGVWKASDGMRKLGRLLLEQGRKPPGRDTLVQTVDRLYRLTGESALRRKVKKRGPPNGTKFAKKSEPISNSRTSLND